MPLIPRESDQFDGQFKLFQHMLSTNPDFRPDGRQCGRNREKTCDGMASTFYLLGVPHFLCDTLLRSVEPKWLLSIISLAREDLRNKGRDSL